MSGANRSLRIVVGAGNYPTQRHPNWGTFVESLADEWARTGSDVAVLAPHPYWSRKSGRVTLRHSASAGPGQPWVLRPGYASWSNWTVSGWSTMHWTLKSFRRAVLRGASDLPFAPDVAYGHFLFPAGFAMAGLAEQLGIPSVVALGEATFDFYERCLGRGFIARTLSRFDGAVSVSQENLDECVERYGLDPARAIVVPNATDTERFRPGDRSALRRELGLPMDRFLVCYAGRFAERKGAGRLLAALRELPEVGAIFLGEGPDRLEGEQVLVARTVTHAEVPQYLAASDLFVLPTLAEGSPNGVIEALACGLPVVSSTIPALHETVDESCALLVDPGDIAALRDAIRSLIDDPPRREAMGQAARARALGSTLADRADKIRAWLGEIAATADSTA